MQRVKLKKNSEKRITELTKPNKVLHPEITKHSNTLEEFQEIEISLQNTFDAIQDGISVLDKDLNILKVNQIMKKRYPTPEPIEGKKCYQAYHGRAEPCENCPSLIALQTRCPQIERILKILTCLCLKSALTWSLSHVVSSTATSLNMGS